MATGFHIWSKLKASNDSIDSEINWSEGQAPSTVNDSARAQMAVQAKWRDDNNGSLTTGGTATAYTLTTNTVFTTLALMANQTLAFTMSATSGATPTLNVDGLGAKVIRNATGVALPTGALLLGSVYRATYNNVSGEWLLLNQPAVLPASIVGTSAIADAAVTYAKMQNVSATSRLLGRATAAAGVTEEITIGSGLLLNSTTISAPAFPPSAAFKNLSIKVASNTTVTVAADFVTTTDGTTYQTTALSGTINLGTNGAANALDAGTVAIDTFYSIWAIAKADGTTAGLASTSATAPTLPTGYTFKARIGWVVTIHASATLYGTWQLGRTAHYKVGLAQTTVARLLASGVAGSTTVPTWVSIDLTTFVPSTASAIMVYATTSSSQELAAAPNASAGAVNSTTNPPPFAYNNTTAAQRGCPVATLPLEATTLQWASGSSAGALFVAGWEDNI